MKTTFDQDTTLFQRLIGSALKNAVSGDVYKWQRPIGSTSEDVVINALPISNGSTQIGIGNVNIYVPDLRLTLNGKPQTMPNVERMTQLTNLAKQSLENFSGVGYGQSYSGWIANQHVFAEPETGSHYVNLRIEFRFFNQS